MDEPTAGVDTASQEVLAEVLQSLAATGVTMVIVTHEIEALRGVITRVVKVTHGHISFDGTPGEYGQRFARTISDDHLHVPGAHDAHHDAEHHVPGPGYAVGPLDPSPRHEGGRRG